MSAAIGLVTPVAAAPAHPMVSNHGPDIVRIVDTLPMLQSSDIVPLYRDRGGLAYEGEGVSQLQHAWQCARLALAAGATPALQLAAWLHDLGHLVSALEGSPTLAGLDDRHETVAAALLEPIFGPAVSQPVALHVLAKRCLVATRPSYRQALSADSCRSLALQGGAMSVDEVRRFMRGGHAPDALRLRVWDDQAKATDRLPTSEEALAELTALMRQIANAAT